MTSIPCSAQDSPTPESDRSSSVSSAEAGNPALGSTDTREGRADGGPGPSSWPRAQSHTSRPCEEEKGALWPLSDSGKHLIGLDSTTTRPGEDPSPHSTFHLPPCQCLSHQVGPGREGRTGWKRLEKWVTLGGLVEGRLGGAGRARRGSLCLLPEGPAPPLLGHLWGQVA